jgi:hypothetical protein
MNVTMMETLQVLFYISIIVACLFVYFNRLFYFLAHLASMEGNLPCLKYIISNSLNMNALISARNDQVINKNELNLN